MAPALSATDAIVTKATPGHHASFAPRRDADAAPIPCRIPTALSDSTFFTECALTYLKGRNGKPWFLHPGYRRPHPPFIALAPCNAMCSPPGTPASIRPDRWEDKAAQHLLHRFCLHGISQRRRDSAAGRRDPG